MGLSCCGCRSSPNPATRREGYGTFEGTSENLLDQSVLSLPTADPRTPAPIQPPWAGDLPLFPSLCSSGLR